MTPRCGCPQKTHNLHRAYCKWSKEGAGTPASLPLMTKPSMEVNISFRVPRALRDAAREKANERQENVSDVLRAALEGYVRKAS